MPLGSAIERWFLPLLTFAWFFANPGINAVLCLGSGGHVAVEYSLGGVCAEQESNSPDLNRARLLANERETVTKGHCGACVDIPLLVPGASRTKATFPELSPRVAGSQTLAHYVSISLDSTPDLRLIESGFVSQPPSLTRLSTVILRT